MVLIKKIISFEKELLLNTRVSEITSISLEHKINKIDDDLISGIFIISGDYKMTEGSIVRDKFSYDVNFDIALDNRYDTKNIVVDIDNFTYEVINDDVLKVYIDLFIEGDILKDDVIVVTNDDINKKSVISNNNNKEMEKNEDVIENDIILNDKEVRDIDNSNILLEEEYLDINNSETYATYYVYIVKEEDSIDKIIEDFGVSKDDLSLYNSIDDIKPGDKIIIPTTSNG